MNKIRVMIVEDTRTIRQFLENIIGNDPRLEVVASVENAEEALRCLARVAPDVISMDIHLPGMNGLEATQRIMEQRPTPIVIVSGSLQSHELRCSMNALEAGALTVVEKPRGTTHNNFEAMAERLCTQLAIMSQVKVIRQRFNRPRVKRARQNGIRFHGAKDSGKQSCDIRMIGIVASTGGPKALQAIFSSLPPSFPVPIVLVQHITPGFHYGFVQWLNDTSQLSVVTAEHGQLVEAGNVYVAPPDFHLLVNGRQLVLRQDEPISAHQPSGTVLLESMASSLGRNVAGVVLTGMGDDGVDGLLSIRRAGGFTISEDESTAVVYGMPGLAARLGASCEQLPLDEIGPRLLNLIPECVGAHL
ncbi:MAG: chemotaxis-specific protein-glutamate methyltransferase CheB [Planctomycetaceae bacterium]